MAYEFHIVDVFTQDRFGGNQLAVLPDATGLTGSQMQSITREFNFAESTFVLPPDNPANTRRVRIFTPGSEIPFAGHPNIGTAFVLAACGAVATTDDTMMLRFEELAGVVPVEVSLSDGRPRTCELTAPAPLRIGESYSVEALAQALGIEAGEIVTEQHVPVAASVGLPFVLVEVASRATLEQVEVDAVGLRRILETGSTDAVHLYTQACAGREWDIQARMFAPGMGVMEDPATGSANCALAAFLASLDLSADGSYAWAIAQGLEMGRPSRLNARVEKHGGILDSVRIAGACVLVARGEIEV